MTATAKTRIAIFASGAGSNAAKLIEYFNGGPGQAGAEVALVVSNKPGAGVLNVAARHSVETVIVDNESFNSDGCLDLLKEKKIDLIVLAGFLRKIPQVLIDNYPHSIINIHPALLPAYGGRGMYGMKVHQAVLSNGEKESGITIHYVDEHYDNGDIIFQAKCRVENDETPDSLAHKIHELEHRYYPEIVEKIAVNLKSAT